MADPKPASGVEPLTEAEQAQLDALTTKKANAEKAAAEKDRKERVAALAPVEALIKLVVTDKVTAAIQTVIDDPNVPFDTKQRVRQYQDGVTYSLGTLQTELAALATPTA